MSSVRRRQFVIGAAAPILGLDVGEDYLDLALLSTGRAKLAYHRVALCDFRRDIVESIARRIADVCGEDLAGAIALVDSPRTPRDIDCSGSGMILRVDAPSARFIDSSLRELLRIILSGTMRPVAMFPTPRLSYFAGCVAQPGCKLHLRAIAEELFASAIKLPRAVTSGHVAGGTFTRFMLAGFAVFPALEQLGVTAFESYPDLQMRLWSDGSFLPPKRMGREALRVRREICARLAGIIRIANFDVPKTLDQADAAVLAMSAAAGSLIELHHPSEGRFAIALDKTRSGGLER